MPDGIRSQTCVKASRTSLEELIFSPHLQPGIARVPISPFHRQSQNVVMTKTSTLQREYEVVMSAFAAKMVSLPGTVNTAETPSIIGVHKRGTLKMIVIHLVSSMALLMKSKLPPRAARGSLGSLSKEKQ